MSIPKHKRWEHKPYTRWVATHSGKCAACSIQDNTISPHHLKHIYAGLSGGMGYKASDWLTTPLCHSCHTKLHGGDRWLIEYQPFMILSTLDIAFRDGIMVCTLPKIGEDLDD